MIILANDGMDKNAIKQLENDGYIVDTNHYDGEMLHKRLAEVDCIVIRSATKLRKPEIDAATSSGRLKLIIRAGVGIDNIDHQYANENGIKVFNTPNSSSDAVAELAIGHMFAIARHIYHANVSMRDGKWLKKQYVGIELSGKTLGLVGFGRIAQSVARKASALGMDIIYHDLLGKKNTDTPAKYVEKDELLKSADFISLHIPFEKENGAYLGKKEFAKMKKGMYIVHTARGGVIDEESLLEALDNGTVAFVALDVFEDEPVTNEKIYKHPKISLTPHIGASTKEAQARIGLETIQVIKNNL